MRSGSLKPSPAAASAPRASSQIRRSAPHTSVPSGSAPLRDNPTKEITAEILAIGEGITTREQATIRLNGGQWDANVDQLTRENEKLRAAQGQVDQSTAASGTISAALREAIVAEAIKSIKEGDKHENA